MRNLAFVAGVLVIAGLFFWISKFSPTPALLSTPTEATQSSQTDTAAAPPAAPAVENPAAPQPEAAQNPATGTEIGQGGSSVAPAAPQNEVKESAVNSQKPSTPSIKVRELIPSTALIREQAARDPHVTPEAIRKFSVELGSRQDAIQTEAEAGKFLRELEDCLAPKSGEAPSATVQSLCLLNARQATQKYPQLKKRYEDLRAKADPKAVEIDELAQ